MRVFLKSGLADEHLRVGTLVQEIMRLALAVDWQSQNVRRATSPLPPIAVSASNLPIAERFLFKQVDQDDDAELDLHVTTADPTQMDEEFWQAYRALDRHRLFEDTIERLRAVGKPLTIGELARELPPTHDLETLSYWLAMAREAGIPLQSEEEVFELVDEDSSATRFFGPMVRLDIGQVEALEAFLNALTESDHWLLLVDLDGGLLPFQKQRVRSSELMERALPCERVIIIENETCQHLLPPLDGQNPLVCFGCEPKALVKSSFAPVRQATRPQTWQGG